MTQKKCHFYNNFLQKNAKNEHCEICLFLRMHICALRAPILWLMAHKKNWCARCLKRKKRVLTEVRKNWCALKRAICTEVQKKLRIWRTSIFCGQMRNFSAPRCANFCFKKFSKKIFSPYQRGFFLRYAVKCHFSVSVKTLKIEF